MPIFLLCLAYLSSQAYIQSWRKISVEPLRDFRFAKSTMGASFIISLLAVYAFRLVIPMMQSVSQGFLDRAVLVAHNTSEDWILTSTALAGYFGDVIPLFAYLVPISVTIYSYLFAALSTLQFPRELARSARSDLLADLAFFVLVFLCGIWLQSLYVKLSIEPVVISLASAFIAASFRNYLEAWRNIPTIQ
jgi:hypothetical protein